MSDYERGIRDAINFMHTHVLEFDVPTGHIRINEASTRVIEYKGTKEAHDAWVAEAVKALVKTGGDA